MTVYCERLRLYLITLWLVSINRLRLELPFCNSNQESKYMDILKIIFAIILPPVGVFMEVGLTGAFWLNILLTLLGYLPGIIHAIWVIAKH